MTAPQQTIAQRLHDCLPSLPPAERRVATMLLGGDPLIGLEPVAALADGAGTSAPTVLRLLERLGFAGYPDFQQQVKQEVRSRLSSPADKYPGPEVVGLASAMRRSIAESLHQTWSLTGPDDLEQAVALIADPDRRILVLGGRFSGYAAAYLAALLELLRPGVVTVPPEGAGRRTALLDVDRHVTVVAFDYRRYQEDTIAFGSTAAAAGGRLVLFTDEYLSPLAQHADVVLTSRVEAASPFDVLTPTVALVEALVAGVVERLGDQTRRRMERFEALSTRHTANSGEETSRRAIS